MFHYFNDRRFVVHGLAWNFVVLISVFGAKAFHVDELGHIEAAAPQCERMLRVRGTVQGVGFRPFVLRLAVELGVTGWVRNDAQGVLLRVWGSAVQLEDLAKQLELRAPAAARVTGVEWLAGPLAEPAMAAGFHIIESRAAAGEIETGAPVDLAPCDDCRRELADPADRRFAYPFINCTQCGPRYSLIERLPYDRPFTTMAVFAMCPECLREYNDPGDRRFHAEPNACPVCGPKLELTDSAGRVLAEGPAALAQAAAALCSGGIVAAKGVGGFHLLADAADEAAVAELRRRKQREEKPFAVMFRDVSMLRGWAEVSSDAEILLESARCPIVLLKKHHEARLAEGVAPGNPWVGALLPSAPVYLLLMGLVNRPLVATSANLSDEPLCTDDLEARQRLAGIADWFLGHNRAIARPMDDSIVRFTSAGAPMVLRRARGYAPGPMVLPAAFPQPVICVGAQMKNTVAVAAGRRLVLSPHLGDLGSVAAYQVFTRTLETLTSLLAAQPALVVCDKHPDYPSTHFALQCGLPMVRVQHHLAHVLAVLLEHGAEPDDVLGVSWDGAGYGEDGTVWGGEFILLEGDRASRFARLRPFRLPGGDAAARDARRVAVALAHEYGGPEHAAAMARRCAFSEADASILQSMLQQGLNSPLCSSVGRLFDGVGFLLGLGSRNSFDGQVPMAVEAAALGASPTGPALPFRVRPAAHGARWEIDWAPALERLLERPSGADPQPATLAAAFHRGLADALLETCVLAGVRAVVLSGGCFQNAVLRHFVESRLLDAGFTVLAARDLPPHDGAIAAGQALGALWNLTTVGRGPHGV
jgi:hydrogenase maturation protein HypF